MTVDEWIEKYGDVFMHDKQALEDLKKIKPDKK